MTNKGKISTVQAIFSLVAFISTIALIVYMVPQMIERQQEADRRLDEATTDFVNVCLLFRDSLCDREMPKLLEQCKTKDLTVCKDGRLASYFYQSGHP